MNKFLSENLPSMKLTFSHLKMDGWNTNFLLGWLIFRGENVSFREGIASQQGGFLSAGFTKRSKMIPLRHQTWMNKQLYC